MSARSPKILVTGATGFIGKALCAVLAEQGRFVRAAVRSFEPFDFHHLIDTALIDSIGPDTDWSEALTGIDTVIHLAARVHVMNDACADPLQAYRDVNVYGTERLSEVAVEKGVRRLIFLSSIKANGEEAPKPYTEDDPPLPVDPYGISKWEAEQALQRIAERTGLEVVILRPPLVYGPGVKANFLQLIKAAVKGVPLPLAGIDNLRSMIFVGNLIDAIISCITHPNAAGRTFLVSDDDDVSTPELIRKIAEAAGRPVRLFYFPVPLMTLFAKLLNKSSTMDRLVGSLTVDCSKIQDRLGWEVPCTMQDGLSKTIDWYLHHERSQTG